MVVPWAESTTTTFPSAWEVPVLSSKAILLGNDGCLSIPDNGALSKFGFTGLHIVIASRVSMVLPELSLMNVYAMKRAVWDSVLYNAMNRF
jgi:hypothetical protein